MPLKMYGKNTETKKTPQIKNVIAIAAGKGGVGKSTVAVNLGLALKKLGYTVGIMDSDLYGPSIRKMLPEDRMPGLKNGKLQPASCCGIAMISMAYFGDRDHSNAIRAPIANRMIGQFIEHVDWGSLDFLLIDFPPGTGDIQLTLAQQAQLSCAIMVTTPQEVAVMDVRKAIHFFEQVQVPVIGIIENMSYYQHPSTGEKLCLFGQGGGEKLAKQSGIPYLGSIPIDPEVSAAGDGGYSLLEKAPLCYASKAFMAIAKQTEAYLDALNDPEESALQSFELVWKEMTS